jgi:aspartyl-tRNA(Asn)/glutamyl-tRNA(Gln) amidotransferase subunit C
MSQLTQDDVKHIAKLSKLHLSNEELGRFSKQLSEVVSHISELNKVETSSTDPTTQTTGLVNKYNSDETSVENCLNQEQSLSGVDDSHNGYFVTSATLSEKGNNT